MNKENLTKLADWLETNMISTPERFNMRTFRQGESGLNTPFLDVHNCGTAGCALGWSPLVPDLGPIESDYCTKTCAKDIPGLNFESYSQRVFQLDMMGDLRWDYMFSGEWSHIDNSARGAVGRIREIVEGKEVNLDNIPNYCGEDY